MLLEVRKDQSCEIIITLIRYDNTFQKGRKTQ